MVETPNQVLLVFAQIQPLIRLVSAYHFQRGLAICPLLLLHQERPIRTAQQARGAGNHFKAISRRLLSGVVDNQDADAIVISCCDDPAVEELREMLSVPVIGAGTAVSAVARGLGKRVGIIGITEYVPEPYRRILGDDLIDLGRPEGVTCTLDLMIGAGRESVLRKARELKAQGANCIALACTGMSTIRIAREIENSCGIPAVDPVMAEGLFAYYACLQSER